MEPCSERAVGEVCSVFSTCHDLVVKSLSFLNFWTDIGAFVRLKANAELKEKLRLSEMEVQNGRAASRSAAFSIVESFMQSK